MPPICLTSGDRPPPDDTAAGRGALPACCIPRRPKPPSCELIGFSLRSTARAGSAQAGQITGEHRSADLAVARRESGCRRDARWIEQQRETDGVERQAKMIGPSLQRLAEALTVADVADGRIHGARIVRSAKRPDPEARQR